MAKNRVMADKNAKVRKEDIKQSCERKTLEMAKAVKFGDATENVLANIGYVPKHGRHPNKVSMHGKKIIREYKSAAKTALMARL